MFRNVVLALSTLVVLGVAFLVYWFVLDEPVGTRPDQHATAETLPVGDAAPADARVRIANMAELPPGKGIEFSIYDSQTGRETQRFQCDEWTPLSGEKNEIQVTRPRLMLRLPSGMAASISADTGRVTVERLEKTPGRPRLGELSGDVRIAVDRGARHEGATPEQRAEDLITIALDHLSFDLELGELHTDSPLKITSSEFELSGRGLDLVWNEADNIVDSLVLHEGGELVLFGGAGLFRGSAAATSQPSTAPAAVAAKPPASQPDPRRARAARRGSGAYTCILTGGVVAEQRDGDEVRGRLEADEVRLLFDVGGAADRFTRPATDTAPASRPAGPARERLVVQWKGPLRLEPRPPASGTQVRRELEALGETVSLTHADGVVRCGHLEYYEHSQQIWLHPRADGRVEFALGAGLSASAGTVYIDQAADVVKLIGDVELLSQRGTQAGRPGQTIRCTEWAELRLAPEPASESGATTRPADELLRYGQLQSARFVGGAHVELGGQTLDASQIDATFKPTSSDKPLSAALETAVASGSARLSQAGESLECERLELAFGVSDDGEPFPARMDARGGVIIARERSWLGGDRVIAELVPVPGPAKPGQAAFELRRLNIDGDAELHDPKNKVAARGRQIEAVFGANNRLSHGTVRGTAERHGLVHASPYTVGGQQVDLDWQAQSLHVDGPARLAFKSQRGLEGQRRERPVPVIVSCNQTLHIDGSHNTVYFAGNVVARSGEEQLAADTLTLLLEDVEKAEPPETAPAPGLAELLRDARKLLNQRREIDRKTDLVDVQLDESGRVRKEPVRLVADNAMVLSESYEPNDPQPLVHSSIAAPQLEVDIVGRQIVTQGRTTLLLTSRRLEAGAAGEPETFGIPSALITRGPSQTAMQCEESMTYALGEEGPARRDSVVFEGGVVFVHRAGREMVNIEQMLPQVATHPELVTNLKSRNTSLQCDRLECGFLIGSEGRAEEPAAAAGRTSMRLTWLIASGRTELRDVQGATVRTVMAQQLDFDRTQGFIRVLGSPNADARIYEEDPDTRDVRSLVGEEFTIDLQANTVRSGATRGQFRESH